LLTELCEGRGFTISIGDTVADAATMEKISKTIQTAKEDVKELIYKAQTGQLEAQVPFSSSPPLPSPPLDDDNDDGHIVH
jgi:hypothetical protein